ncbi:MAG: IS1096 element passenger TnpR family protein, partial [Flavobacteriales bacterium]
FVRMRIYRFRVLIDHPSEAFRDIEIGSEQTFLDFHKAIKEAFAFIGQEMAAFYVSNDDWDKGTEIPLADMGFAEEGAVPALMHEVRISDHIRSASQRFIYAYDFLHMWMFMVELVSAGEPEEGVTYPRVVLSMHQAPDEHSKEEDIMAGIEEEDPYALDEEEHGFDPEEEDDLFGDEGEEHDEFGHGAGDEGGDDFR